MKTNKRCTNCGEGGVQTVTIKKNHSKLGVTLCERCLDEKKAQGWILCFEDTETEDTETIVWFNPKGKMPKMITATMSKDVLICLNSGAVIRAYWAKDKDCWWQVGTPHYPDSAIEDSFVKSWAYMPKGPK